MGSGRELLLYARLWHQSASQCQSRAKGSNSRPDPDHPLEHVVGLVVSVALLAYLACALLRPGRF